MGAREPDDGLMSSRHSMVLPKRAFVRLIPNEAESIVD